LPVPRLPVEIEISTKYPEQILFGSDAPMLHMLATIVLGGILVELFLAVIRPSNVENKSTKKNFDISNKN
jgi:hypothetical protein